MSVVFDISLVTLLPRGFDHSLPTEEWSAWIRDPGACEVGYKCKQQVSFCLSCGSASPVAQNFSDQTPLQDLVIKALQTDKKIKN